MDIEALVMQAFQATNYANGALLIVACAAAAVLLSLAPRIRNSQFELPIQHIARAAFALFCALALANAFYPNYSDHAGPAMTGLGMKLLEGVPLYPNLDYYGFHGLLYGPLLAEFQAGAIFLGSTLAGMPVILASKLAGALAFFLASGLLFAVARGWGFARSYYALFLLPFHIVVSWNRCEPLFLLLVAFSFWAVEFRARRSALLILGICAGLACGFKPHGILYIVPAMLLFWSREKISVQAVLLVAAAAAVSYLLLFLPGNVSPLAYADYLLFAARHGLSWNAFLVNLLFVCALWSPLLAALAVTRSWRTLLKFELLALLALQLVVAMIGSKPGAGIHHLLPFIPANALVFARCIESGPKQWRSPVSAVVWIALLIPGLAACGMQTWGMAWNWPIYERMRRELVLIQEKFPDVVMGLAGNQTYPYVYFRPMLEFNGAPQVEYSSYMDLQLVGVPDTPLRQAFDSCEIGHLAVPRGEAPFSMITLYSATVPLFSDALRETFARRYSEVAHGAWYDVYECRRN